METSSSAVSRTEPAISTGFGVSADDAFVVKLDAQGDVLWVNSIGGPASGDRVDSVGVDLNGGVVAPVSSARVQTSGMERSRPPRGCRTSSSSASTRNDPVVDVAPPAFVPDAPVAQVAPRFGRPSRALLPLDWRFRAIVVPNSRLAYLARLAFADGKHRVFYNDFVAAIEWLKSADPG